MSARIAILTLLVCCGALQSAELRVPAFTAYIDPKIDGARISSRSGVSGWNDPTQKILWFGELKNTGSLDCAVALRLPQGARSKLRLSVSGQAREVTVEGRGQ